VSSQEFGRYQVMEEVGRGAMGVVYRAQDPIIGRTVAIKAINRSVLASMDVGGEEYLERFRREAQVAGGMNHPNIVKVFDLGDDYIVMEFVTGRSLATLIRAGGLTQDRGLEIVGAVAGALDYAHAQGITHRDIKPANVMVQDDGVVKVMDFGLARIESSNLTAAGAVMGSASYMAPEIVMGRPADPRSDIFSLGVLAYETLGGSRPFPGKTVSVIMMSIVRESPRPAHEANLPVEFDVVFEKALAKEPERRYQSAGDFAEALRQAQLAGGWPTRQAGTASGPGDLSVVTVTEDELGPTPGAPDEATLLVAEPGSPATGMAGDADTQQPQGEATLLVTDTPAPVAPTLEGEKTLVVGASEVNPLEELVTEVPEPFSAPPPAGAPGARRSGKGALVAGVAVIVLAGIGAIAWWLTGRGGPATPPDVPPAEAASASASAGAHPEQPVVAPSTRTLPPRPAGTAQRETRRPSPSPAPAPTTASTARSRVAAPVTLAADMTPPKKLQAPPVTLPREKRGLRLPASVLLEFTVTEDGRVGDPAVLESGGSVLDELCLKAVLAWRYEPAVRGGVKVPVRQKARFSFRER